MTKANKGNNKAAEQVEVGQMENPLHILRDAAKSETEWKGAKSGISTRIFKLAQSFMKAHKGKPSDALAEFLKAMDTAEEAFKAENTPNGGAAPALPQVWRNAKSLNKKAFEVYKSPITGKETPCVMETAESVAGMEKGVKNLRSLQKADAEAQAQANASDDDNARKEVATILTTGDVPAELLMFVREVAGNKAYAAAFAANVNDVLAMVKEEASAIIEHAEGNAHQHEAKGAAAH